MKASFYEAYKQVKAFEGGYSNITADKGGETYAGIARNFHPNWKGWEIIDAITDEIEAASIKWVNEECKNNKELSALVLAFYKEEFWNSQKLFELPHKLASEIFEQSVNLGKGQTGIFIQKLCNALNYYSNGSLFFEDLKVDGVMGALTLRALKIILEKKASEPILIYALNAMQAEHYITLADKNTSQRKFITGWLKRT